MVKTEQFKDNDQQMKPIAPTELATSLPLRSSMLQAKSSDIPYRTIDPHAIDISSIKGRFAWEKIALGDTYIPVIFRGSTKYFCVKMLYKLLPGYPEDFIRHSSFYEYRKPIDLYMATSNELLLLNKINVHHCHGEYSRSPFTAVDQLVRVSDFLPFYEHLRLYNKSSSIPRAASIGSIKSPLAPAQRFSPKSLDFATPVPVAKNIPRNSNMPFPTPSLPTKSIPVPELSRANSLPGQQSIAIAPPTVRVPKANPKPLVPGQKVVQHPSSSIHTQQPPTSLFNSARAQENTESPSRSRPIPIAPPTSDRLVSTGVPSIYLTPPKSVTPSPVLANNERSLIASENPVTSASKPTPSSPSISTSKSPSFRSGWLQINKLYTSYITTNSSSHHLYRIPVSLLTFYDLIRSPSLENNSNELKDASFSFEKTLATPDEIKHINDLCLKQAIKPFAIDTKLISLETFYHYSSANILFVKELPYDNPKAYICKDWASIVRIKGGICLLRHRKTLHEQTVPFIEENILKDFALSTESLASASLTIPTAAELEFLQLVLFFSNISIELNNAKLIDLQSVQKEYHVDVMLLFNDKFPLNVLDYHHQGNRITTAQPQVSRDNATTATATTNTFAQSTPPPSPVSPATNNIPVNPTAQLTSSSSSTSSNRYQKTITFHGQSMTAYICSGLGTNAQRECVSVRALCDVLFPNSSIIDKLEIRLLRLLRLKNINRFRPQYQQALGVTRLVDVKDVEKNWEYIQQEMCISSDNEGEKNIASQVKSSKLEIVSMASNVDEREKICENVQRSTSMEVSVCEKRPIEGELETGTQEEKRVDIARPGGLAKRIRISNDSNEPSKITRPMISRPVCDRRFSFRDGSTDDDNDDDDDMDDKNPSKIRRNSTTAIKIVAKKPSKKTAKKPIVRRNDRLSRKSTLSTRNASVQPTKKKIKIIRKRRTPRIRAQQQSVAAWIRKYGIEDCCVRLDLYDPIVDNGRH